MHNFKKVGIFVGGAALGMVVGSIGMIRFAIKNDAIRAGIVKEIVDWIFSDESVTRHELYNEIMFNIEADAEKVLADAKSILYTYGTVTVADIYDLSGGITSCYTDGQYGWTNLDEAKVVKGKNGYYILHMPKSVKINK